LNFKNNQVSLLQVIKNLFLTGGYILMKTINYSDCSEQEQKLIEAAKEARSHACALYSKFDVGAAVLTAKGNIYKGCNIESADYTLTTHAEMHAVNCAVYAGDLPVKAVAVVLKCGEGYPTPCGLCRQKLREFSDKNAVILNVNLNDDGSIKVIYKTTLIDLLPYSFGRENLDM
jgi:cytidine deaminase